MRNLRDEAVVLRTQLIGDADRIITLLTRHHGRARAVAKGVRRTTSRFGARLEPFSYVEVEVHQGKSLDTITRVDEVKAFGESFALDASLWSTGQIVLETAERLTPVEHAPAPKHFLLVTAALRALANSSTKQSAIIDSYLLRALAIEGLAPSMSQCAGCGAAGTHDWFDVREGGVVCSNCRSASATAPSQQSLALMNSLLQGDLAHVESQPERYFLEANTLTREFFQWHIERRLNSLRVAAQVSN
jgi:DNA repair protein RecO (recombination protein O)